MCHAHMVFTSQVASDAMHFSSAKRGHGIAMHGVCLSVCPSVTLVDCDHISWNSWKIISRLISVGFLLSSPNIMDLLRMEHFQNGTNP